MRRGIRGGMRPAAGYRDGNGLRRHRKRPDARRSIGAEPHPIERKHNLELT